MLFPVWGFYFLQNRRSGLVLADLPLHGDHYNDSQPAFVPEILQAGKIMFFAKGRTGTIIFKEIWTGSVKPERKLGGYAK